MTKILLLGHIMIPRALTIMWVVSTWEVVTFHPGATPMLILKMTCFWNISAYKKKILNSRLEKIGLGYFIVVTACLSLNPKKLVRMTDSPKKREASK